MRSLLYKIVLSLIAISTLLTFVALLNDLSFADLWLTPDQQGRYFLERGKYEEAILSFDDPLWKGIVAYRIKQYEKATQFFVSVETPNGLFDLGNSLAQLGNLEASVNSYLEALELRPDFPEAEFNLQLVQSLIESSKDEKKKDQKQGGEPSFDPDEIKFDKKKNEGEKGEIDMAELSDEQMAQLLLKQLQTSPTQFLKAKFNIQSKLLKSDPTE